MKQTHVFEDVLVRVSDAQLPGLLARPADAPGLVIFAHGSGSSRLSTRNQAVARALVDRGCATLLFDLLTMDESANRQNVFDIPLLGRRVVEATEWLARQQETAALPIGYFGASTGAAAALVAAADLRQRVSAVVSRGGRPDLAIPSMPDVTAPTLFIVGSRDEPVLSWNREAQQHHTGENHLAVIEGATHLFEEPGTLEEAARIAGDWFLAHF